MFRRCSCYSGYVLLQMFLPWAATQCRQCYMREARSMKQNSAVASPGITSLINCTCRMNSGYSTLPIDGIEYTAMARLSFRADCGQLGQMIYHLRSCIPTAATEPVAAFSADVFQHRLLTALRRSPRCTGPAQCMNESRTCFYHPEHLMREGSSGKRIVYISLYRVNAA